MARITSITHHAGRPKEFTREFAEARRFTFSAASSKGQALHGPAGSSPPGTTQWSEWQSKYHVLSSGKAAQANPAAANSQATYGRSRAGPTHCLNYQSKVPSDPVERLSPGPAHCCVCQNNIPCDLVGRSSVATGRCSVLQSHVPSKAARRSNAYTTQEYSSARHIIAASPAAASARVPHTEAYTDVQHIIVASWPGASAPALGTAAHSKPSTRRSR